MTVAYDFAAYTATQEPFDRIAGYHVMLQEASGSEVLFLHPIWQQVWLRHFGKGLAAKLIVVRQGEMPIGFTGLGVAQERAQLLGSADVCDYLDCVVQPGHEMGFFAALFQYARRSGIAVLDFSPVRGDSAVVRFGIPLARQLGFSVACEQEAVTFACDLPSSWDTYLVQLSGKQRHETRRKLRKTQGAGRILYRTVHTKSDVDRSFDVFLRLFQESRQDKQEFLIPAREYFFRDIAMKLSSEGLAHLGFLDIDSIPVAAVLCFDYKKTRFLYNSGYDPRYRMVNPGFACKVFSIRDAIERGFFRYDFLKGAEPYKRHLGGMPEAVYRCSVTLA
ncbi:MAG: GNAT family N-acetyltransferase [Desulfobacterota bacterium]|nr:GNAT family N-acetyltransferase [Thermodesulfobacteriota bacterium]